MLVEVGDIVGVRGQVTAVRYGLPPLHEVVSVHATFRPRIVAAAHDVVGVRGVFTVENLASHRDVVGVHTTASTMVVARRTVRDVVGVRDRSHVRLAVALHDVLTVRATDARRVRYVAGDRVAVSAHDQVRLVVRCAVVDRCGVSARSSVRLRHDATAHDIVAVRGTVAARVRYRVLARDVVGVVGRAAHRLRVHVGALDRVGVKCRVNALVRYFAPAHEKLFVLDYSVVRRIPVEAEFFSDTPIANTDVWTADARSWGMSRYVGVPVRQWCVTTSAVYGVGDGGVYTLAGPMDVSYIQTGKTRFESQFKSQTARKRLSSVYTYATHEAPLDIQLGGDLRREWQVAEYTQPTSSEDATRAVRTSVGRGFASNFYSLRIGNQPFDLQMLEVEFATTQRRI